MCDAVWIGKKRYDTISALSSALGRPLIMDGGMELSNGVFCLCPVDLMATAKAAGYKLTNWTHDPTLPPGDCRFTKIVQEDDQDPIFMMLLVSLSAFFCAGCFFIGLYAAISWLVALTWM